eukprot:scaffold79196_cov36-Cyclotella_meneghiniana.AAC.6
MSDKFDRLLTVATSLAQKKLSPANSSKLLNLLLDPIKSMQLKIELSAYVEGLRPLHDICYWLETDATDVPFRV